MSCCLNIKLAQFNLEFEFPGENLNQSEKRIHFFNFKNVRNRKTPISSYNRFWGLHAKIN